MCSLSPIMIIFIGIVIDISLVFIFHKNSIDPTIIDNHIETDVSMWEIKTKFKFILMIIVLTSLPLFMVEVTSCEGIDVLFMIVDYRPHIKFYVLMNLFASTFKSSDADIDWIKVTHYVLYILHQASNAIMITFIVPMIWPYIFVPILSLMLIAIPMVLSSNHIKEKIKTDIRLKNTDVHNYDLEKLYFLNPKICVFNETTILRNITFNGVKITELMGVRVDKDDNIDEMIQDGISTSVKIIRSNDPKLLDLTVADFRNEMERGKKLNQNEVDKLKDVESSFIERIKKVDPYTDKYLNVKLILYIIWVAAESSICGLMLYTNSCGYVECLKEQFTRRETVANYVISFTRFSLII